MTRTLPGGGTEITDKYLDGQLKSLTGTAVVNKHYEYGVNADGSRWTEIFTGPDGSSSPMWEKTVTDMLGRTARIEKPAFGGSIVTNTYTYNAKGQLTRISSPASPPTLYEYDELGNQIRSGKDVDQNGQLDLASMDVINDAQTYYEQDAYGWLRVRENTAYPYDNDSSTLTMSISKTRISGFDQLGAAGPGNLTAETVSIDRFGNATTNRTFIDRDTVKVTQLVTAPDSTNVATTVTVNGLLQSRETKTGVKTTYDYDALGRRIAAETVSGAGATPSRLTGTYTHYNSLGQIDYTEDAAGNRTTYAYDDAGRRVEVTDPLTNITHTAYDAQGRAVGTWGATYPVLYDYDDYGRMSAMYTLRDDSITNNTYSGLRSQVSSFDETTWYYDPASGLMTNKVYADGNGPSYSYNSAGRLTQRTWARGIKTDYSYDLLGQLTNVSYSDSTPDIIHTYDRMGNRLSAITEGVSTNIYQYDPDTLQLTNEWVHRVGASSPRSLSRSYDSYGRPSGIALGSNCFMRE